MFHILGFLFFFILIILVIGLALISKVIRTILGIGRRMTTGNASSSTNTSSRNSQYNSSSSSESNSQRQSNETTSGRKKIFGSDEGEYIDFEEVKEYSKDIKIISPLKKDFLFTDKSVFKWGNFLYLYTQYIRLFFIIVHQILYRHLTLNSLTERNNGF